MVQPLAPTHRAFLHKLGSVSLRKRYRLTPSIERLQNEIDSLPIRFNADSDAAALRILNAMDAALDRVKEAKIHIRKGIIDA